MRFLADEDCDFVVVRTLRAAGHDVRAFAEETTRSDDREVIALAAHESRVLITEDKDFGWLAFVAGAERAGVLLLRFPANTRGEMARSVESLVSEHGEQLVGCFAVLQPATPG